MLADAPSLPCCVSFNRYANQRPYNYPLSEATSRQGSGSAAEADTVQTMEATNTPVPPSKLMCTPR